MDEYVRHFLVQNIVEGVLPKPMEQHVEDVVLRKKIRNLLGKRLIHLRKVLHYSDPQEPKRLLRHAVGSLVRWLRGLLVTCKRSWWLQLSLNNIVRVLDKLV